MNVPIVLIIFNRPHTTQKVFEVISKIKPPKLFLIADGPRTERPDDPEKCQIARRIVDSVDWDCQIFKNYSDVNLGCRDRVSSGLDWVFSHVNEAIILEDDCVPNLSFFRFCEELLDYYGNDERIMMISGNNNQFGHHTTNDSYYFSRYTHIWGWATWKRAWNLYDLEMSSWPMVQQSSWLKAILDNQKSINYWSEVFKKTYEENENNWGYRWTFSCWLQHGLTIIPSVNLVSNIGFAEDATHTFSNDHPTANLPTKELQFPLKHPSIIIRDFEADYRTQHTIMQPPLSSRIKRKLKKIVTMTPSLSTKSKK